MDNPPIISIDNGPAIMEINTVIDVMLGIVNPGANNGPERCEFIFFNFSNVS